MYKNLQKNLLLKIKKILLAYMHKKMDYNFLDFHNKLLNDKMILIYKILI